MSRIYFWSRNLKYLRHRKKVSQDELAEILTITRSKLAAHESGKTLNPPVEDLLRFSEYYGISVDSLLKVDLSKLGELNLRDLEAGNDVYMTGTKLRVLAISVDKNSRENVEYVPINAKAGYLSGYSDPEFIAGLEKYSIPDLPLGSYRMFEISGDSMFPIPAKSKVITQYVEDWKAIKRTLCVVILKSDIVFKEVTVEVNGTFTLSSYNPLYNPYPVKISDVLEIWKYHSYQSKEVPQRETNMQQLADLMLEMNNEIKKITRTM